MNDDDPHGLRLLGPLLNVLLFAVLFAVVYLGQPGNLDVDSHGFDAATPGPSARMLHRFDCWNSTNPRPGVIPGGVVYNSGTGVRHSSSDALTGHFLNHLDDGRLAAFCTH